MLPRGVPFPTLVSTPFFTQFLILSADPDSTPLKQSELLARLAAHGDADGDRHDAADDKAAAGRITVVTPNARLAASLAAEFNALQAARGLAAWATPDILPFGAFIERLHEDLLYSAHAAADRGIAALLSAAEEQHIWQDIIEQSPWGGQLLSGAQAAAQCRASWQLAHAWRIAGAVTGTPAGSQDIAENPWLADAQAEDARAFAQWARAYALRTARAACTDRARLPDVVAPLLADSALMGALSGALTGASSGASPAALPAALSRPALLVVHAFDIVTAQQRAFFDACRQAGTTVVRSQPDPQQGRVRRVSFPSARDELAFAARWARQRLEEWRHGGAAGARDSAREMPRIAVVVPDLEARRKEVVRVFSRTLEPGWGLPGRAADVSHAAGHGAPLFNVSLGIPLSEWPVVDAALALLELCGGEMEFTRVSRLLRSPFIEGADAEIGARARLDAALRERVPPRLRLAAVLAAVRHATDPDGHRPAPACPRLLSLLEKVFALARTQLQGGRSPQEWARRYSELLQASGFPGERKSDSAEYQTLAKWRETLGELARLERVAPRMGHAQALARLRRLCTDTLFQPRMAADGGDAPIQVLGILESGGASYDHLWVSGLTEQAWPLAARPDPFLPIALQKKAGIPQAVAESALALDERITREWRAAADEVVFSHARVEGDVALLPSPLTALLPEESPDALAVPAQATHRDRLFAAGPAARTAFEDTQAPPHAGREVRGGTRVLSDQAACPFRACARHRLDADPLAAPAAGLDAAARGKLLHALFARIWIALKTKAGLEAASPEELGAIIDHAAKAAVARLRAAYPDIIGDRYAALECARLARLARDWLALERERPDFEVIALEDTRVLMAGPLTLRGRIDRMDRLADGAHALIDYKTGRTGTAAWLDVERGRPDDPQLPLYAVNAGERISALAFARLRKGDMKFDGIARDKDLLPGVPDVAGHRQARHVAADWDALLAGWRAQIDALAEDFAAGDARVDPKVPGVTCTYCGLQPLCRVHERYSPLSAGEDEADEGGEGAAPGAADPGGEPGGEAGR